MKQFNIFKSAITLRKAIYSTAGLLLLCTIMSGIVLSSTTTHAVTKSSTATVNVTLSCTMSTSPGTGGTATTDGYSYSATIDPGQYAEINGTIMTTTCTGTGNYSLYAIGYSGDSYDTPTNTQLISSNPSVANIPTGTATSGNTSNWAFKLVNSGSYSPTIISPYNNYASIPGDDFTKIATYIPGTTGSAATSSVQAKYQVYITSTQPASNYTGKVKYTMVYPNDAPAPTQPPYMQDLTLADCQSGASSDNLIVTDRRDDNDYTVKYINGQCWMTQNLRLTGTVSATDSNFSGGNFNVSQYSLDPTDSTYANHCDSTNGYNYACVYDSGSETTGVWYNYYAASGGTISGSSNSTAATNDICPSGWHLPSGPNTTSGTDYNKLVGNTTSGWQKPTAGLTAFGAVTGGFYSNGSLLDTHVGRWWSATVGSTTDHRYDLAYISSTGQFYGGISSSRYNGYFVRCVRSS